MKKLIFILLCFFASKFFPQVFWTETFGAGACSAGALAATYVGPNGAWTVTNTGTNNSSANEWFVSAAERGVGAGFCGAGCAGTNNKTLHIGSTGIFLDMGASYNETAIANASDKRAESPIINCTGKVGITLAFNYIENGQGLLDNATLWYFNGLVWAQISDPAKTLCCGGVACTGFNQGLWVAYTIGLPASANNNPNVKIGFRWVNNGDGIGVDPSIAIDDITLSVPVVLPIELMDFYYTTEMNSTNLIWKTVTEKNSDYYEIQKSEDGLSFNPIGRVQAAFNSNSLMNYSFNDTERLTGITYYRLKMVDKDGTFKYSKLIAVDSSPSLSATPNYFLNKDHQIEINKSFTLVNGYDSFSILSSEGKTLVSYNLADYISDDKILIPIQNIAQGIYLGQLKGYSAQKSFKFFASE